MVMVAFDRGVGLVFTVVALEWGQAFVLVHVVLEIDQRLKNSAAIFFWAGLRLIASRSGNFCDFLEEVVRGMVRAIKSSQRTQDQDLQITWRNPKEIDVLLTTGKKNTEKKC